jgi:hypothetical protein
MGRPGEGGDRGRCVKGLTLCSRDGGYATSCRSVCGGVDVWAAYGFFFALMGLGLVTDGSGPGDGVLAVWAAVVHMVAAPETAAVVVSEDALCWACEWARKAERKPPKRDGRCVGMVMMRMMMMMMMRLFSLCLLQSLFRSS